MKDTGMIRNLDSLGRIVVPMEIRMTRNIDIGDPIEFFILDDHVIVLRKYTSTECTFCRSLDQVTYFKEQFICNRCLSELGSPEEMATSHGQEEQAEPVSYEYVNDKKKAKTEEMLQRLQAAIQEHPEANQKALASILGISQARVSQLKRKLASIAN